MKYSDNHSQRKTGGTIEPPSNFQFKTTKSRENKAFSADLPHGHEHTHAQRACAQSQENGLFDIIEESLKVDVLAYEEVFHLELRTEWFLTTRTSWQCTVDEFNGVGYPQCRNAKRFRFKGQRINGMNVPLNMEVWCDYKEDSMRLTDFWIVAIDGEATTITKIPSNDDYKDEMDTEDKIKYAKMLLKTFCSSHNYTLAFSGGKDSVVLSWLTKIAGVKVPMVYNNTTIDPPGTLKFVRSQGAMIKTPEKSFLELVEQKGYPTMFRRFCCEELKEKYIADYLLTGVRKSESVKRNKNYCAFEDIYKYTKRQQTKRLHPLLYFTNADIEYIMDTYQLECHPLYYDQDGKFHVERRLGCIGCPLQSDRGIQDFTEYPKLLVEIAKAGNKFHLRHGRTLRDSYENLCYNLFYSNHGYNKFCQAFRGLFYTDPKEILEDYFKIKLP